MADKFVTWLEDVPAELKKFFTNPTVDTVITGGLGIASMIDPALAPLFSGIAAAVAKAEALAAAANLQNGSGAQKLALATADAQAIIQAYEQETGTTFEPANITALVNAVVAFLNSVPSPGAIATAPAPSTVNAQASEVRAAPANTVVVQPHPSAPSVQEQAKTGTLL